MLRRLQVFEPMRCDITRGKRKLRGRTFIHFTLFSGIVKLFKSSGMRCLECVQMEETRKFV
jgi:hypothetical protein